MKSLISVALLATLAACGGASMSDDLVASGGALESPANAIPSADAISDPGGDASFGNLLNDVRLDNGADPVSYDARLNEAAQLHAEDMLENNYFSHTGLDGSTVGSRVRDAGYDYRTVGENIASGYRTEESVLDGWVNSPGHQRNNVNPNFEDFGLGYVADGRDSRWVLVLGAER